MRNCKHQWCPIVQKDIRICPCIYQSLCAFTEIAQTCEYQIWLSDRQRRHGRRRCVGLRQTKQVYHTDAVVRPNSLTMFRSLALECMEECHDEMTMQHLLECPIEVSVRSMALRYNGIHFLVNAKLPPENVHSTLVASMGERNMWMVNCNEALWKMLGISAPNHTICDLADLVPDIDELAKTAKFLKENPVRLVIRKV